MEQRAGWYDDPEDPLYLRYFDGIIWTKNRQPKASPTAGRSSIGYAGPPGTFGGPAAGGPQDTRGAQGPPPSGWGQQTPPHPPQQPQQGNQGWGQQPPQGWGQAPQYGPAYGAGYAGAGVKTTPDGAVLAGWGQRLGAYVIDSIITTVILLVTGAYWINQLAQWYLRFFEAAMAAADAGRPTPTPDFTQIQNELLPYLIPLILLSLGIGLVYHVAFLVWRGATPGKMVLGLEVRRRDRPGHPSLVTALLRQVVPLGTSLIGLVPLLSLLQAPLWFLDYFFPLWDPQNQALHDKVASTNVVVKQKHRRG
ncbi:MAG: RDD family protein [Actinomycetota bacterium]|nr:RDD family protein [Actinomycetota bacterium]